MAAVAALLLSACGARVPPYFPAAQVSAGNGSGGAGPGSGSAGGNQAAGTPTTLSSLGIGGGGGTQTGGGTGGPAAQSGSGAASGATPAAAAALTPDTFNLDPRAEAAYCPASSANKASDVGVTPSSINIGNVTGLSGLLSNNFNQGPEAVTALFAAVNNAGGICGRKLNLSVEDDGQDVSHNSADIQDLIPKSLAFVGSTSDADNGGVPSMEQAGIPDLGQAINFERGSMPNYFTAGTFGAQQRGGQDYIYDTLAAGLKANGHFPTKMAFLSFSIPISKLAAEQFSTVFQQAGSQICYTNYAVSPAAPNLTSDVLSMEQNGCNGVFTTMDVTGNAKLMQAMYNQGYHPSYAGTTLDGYTPAQISTAGQQQAQGFQVFLNFAPFNESQPAINMYISQLHTYEPGKQPSAFGIEAWSSAQLFLYALIKSGPNPTRSSIKSIIGGLTSWNTRGAMAPANESTRQPGNCLVDLQIKGNDFVRVWPASGFFCSNNLVAVQANP